MTQPAVSKHWRRVVSHPDRPQSNQAHLTMLQWYNMHADIIQENNSEPSEMKPNLADRTCELLKWLCNYRKLHNATTREQFWQYSLLLLTKPLLRCGQMELEMVASKWRHTVIHTHGPNQSLWAWITRQYSLCCWEEVKINKIYWKKFTKNKI